MWFLCKNDYWAIRYASNWLLSYTGDLYEKDFWTPSQISTFGNYWRVVFNAGVFRADRFGCRISFHTYSYMMCVNFFKYYYLRIIIQLKGLFLIGGALVALRVKGYMLISRSYEMSSSILLYCCKEGLNVALPQSSVSFAINVWYLFLYSMYYRLLQDE